jgi:anti-sigma regulatory factor (Ser/Thr protein kinase)
MAGIATLWNRALESGASFCETPSELRRNRVLNLILFIGVIGNTAIVATEIGLDFILFKLDFGYYGSTAPYFYALNLGFYATFLLTFFLKNRTGSLHATYLSTTSFTLYIVGIGAFLGEVASFHVVLITILPIIFMLYPYEKRGHVFIHMIIMFAGLITLKVCYALIPPVFPIPAYLTQIVGYLIWGAAALLLLLYSMYNWKQVTLTEGLLQDKTNQTEKLINDILPKLEVAERKYRHLVDDSEDVIFLLDSNARFISLNAAAGTVLGYRSEELEGHIFCEIIADGPEGDVEINRNIVRQYFRDFFASDKSFKFRASFQLKHMYEQTELDVHLQKNIVDGQVEVLGKASVVHRDPAQFFLERERGTYVIANSITHAEMVSRKLTERLERYFGTKAIKSIRLGLREILINAIEHGNLNVSFAEKTAAIDRGDYLEFLIARQKDPLYAEKKVRVDFVLDPRRVLFRITDDGEGFDHQAFITRIETDDDMLELGHGRGILMTRNIFDRVQFSRKGNQILLIKDRT